MLAVDRDLASAQETVGLIEQSNGEAVAFSAEVTREATLHAVIESAVAEWGRLDILHNNVGAESTSPRSSPHATSGTLACVGLT